MAAFVCSGVLFLFLCFTEAVLASDKVPVLVWTNDGSFTFPQQLAGHSTSRQDFRKSFVRHLTASHQDNVVVFLQDKLSSADFAHFADIYGSSDGPEAFTHVKSFMSEMTSTYLPHVSSPSAELLDLQNSISHQVHVIESPQDGALPIVKGSGPHMFVVKLSELHHSRKSLTRLDKIIGTFTSQLMSLSRPFVAFYTAVSPSLRSAERQHKSRQLMSSADSESITFVNISDSFYLYSKNVSLTISSNISASLSISYDDNMGSECNSTSDNCTIILNCSDVTTSTVNFYDPYIILKFQRTRGINSGFWYLSQFSFQYWNSSYNKANNSAYRDDYAAMVAVMYDTNFFYQTPFDYSYHCNKPPTFTVKNVTGLSTEGAPVIKFDSIQVQAFGIKGGRFGHYNDCVGFFTVGTWMFIVSTAILLAVLFFGIIMILNLTTMDRYDDAKGKTITVAAAD